MYRIAVLINSEAQEAFFTEQISQFCAECERFPVIETFRDQEHLRALYRNTRIIWCSDLDFSLHAFRLRADYFLLEPVTKAAFQQGLYVWLNEKNSVAQLRPNYAETNKEDYS